MSSIEYYFEQLLAGFENGMYKFVNMGDPIVVSIFLFIILSPFALGYIILARIAMLKFS